jgi:hypothetical protein
MSRTRWFKLIAKGELSVLLRQLSAKPFNLDEPISSGFRIEKKSKNSFFGQFIDKRTVDQIVLLPSGDEFKQEIATIEVTRFGVDTIKSEAFLYTCDGPRSLTPFLSNLSEATKFTCAVDPIEIDVSKWIDRIASELSGVATYLDITGIAISGEAQGRLAVSSKNDVHKAMRDFLGTNHSGTIENAKLRVMLDQKCYSVELGRRATLKTPTGFPYQGVEILRKAMLESYMNNKAY